MRGTARFHADQARRQPGEEWQHLRSTKRPTDNDLAARINSKNVAKCQLETSCRVPGHGLHGRKCIAVAADSAAKIKNTKPGPLAITVTMTSPMPYPPDAASMARATPTMRNNAARNA